MARKLTRQQAMVEILDAMCPAGPWLTYDDAVKIAAACEAVAALYEKGGALHPTSALGFAVKPESLKNAFLAAVRIPAKQDA
jgi:hypothetical protein